MEKEWFPVSRDPNILSDDVRNRYEAYHNKKKKQPAPDPYEYFRYENRKIHHARDSVRQNVENAEQTLKQAKLERIKTYIGYVTDHNQNSWYTYRTDEKDYITYVYTRILKLERAIRMFENKILEKKRCKTMLVLT